MEDLCKLIINSKMHNESSTLAILDKFSPLINKYSRKLAYDGAHTDLVICLLETIESIPVYTNKNLRNDAGIIAYINTSIKHKYIILSKKNCKITNSETELNTDFFGENPYNTVDDKLFIQEILDKLPVFQKDVIKKIYINNIAENDLAKQLRISRQAINRTKNRALNNLRKFLN